MKPNPYYYQGANPTVDLLIMNPEGKFLMIKRGPNNLACPNMWAFPGGFIDTIAKKGEAWLEGLETPEIAALREVLEETNLDLKNPELIFVGVFEGNNRDPRDNEESWSKSFAFAYKIPSEIYEAQKDKLRGMDPHEEIQAIEWLSIEEIRGSNLAFDHKEIFEQALKKLQPAPISTSKSKP